MVSAGVRRESREVFRRDGNFKRTAVGQSFGAEGPWLASVGVGVRSGSVAHTRGLGAAKRRWGRALLRLGNRQLCSGHSHKVLDDF